MYTDHNNLLNARDTITINGMKLELSQKAYEIARLRNELGLTIQLDVIKAYDDMMLKTNTIESSKLTFYKAYKNFENFINFSPIVDE